MSAMTKIELVLHPDRIRILQTLAGATLTTRQISAALPGVPTSSIYRHLKKLLDGGIIEVAETRRVKGVEEKYYRLTSAARLSPHELANLSPADHVRHFATYSAALLQGFADYIENSPDQDYVRDRAGYSEVAFYASEEEFDRFQAALNQAVLPLLQNPPGPGRIRRRLATITHPISQGEEDD